MTPTPTEPYLLGLDIGTSSVKATLFDSRGGQIAASEHEYTLDTPGPDLVELDPDVYWQSTQCAISDLLNRTGAPSRRIAALGVTSQGETLIVTDAKGAPLRKAIVWLDNRATQEARLIADNFPVEDVYRITGQQEVVPGWTACKILWLRNHEPDIFRRTAKFLLVEDFIIFKLTGRFVTDHALAPCTLYYDLTTGDWWDDILAYLGVTRERLPDLRHAGVDGHRVTASIGLDQETLVVTTPIDQITGAVGAGNIAPGTVTETTGSALAICACCDGRIYDPQRRVGLYRHASRNQYVLLPWVPTAGMLLRWFRDLFGQSLSYAELDREAAGVAAGSDGLTVLPHFSGALCPHVNPAARGVLHGLTLGHTRGHIARAIMESVAFILRENLDLLDDLGVETGIVCSLGGGARNDFWLQIKADVLNREIRTVETKEATGLGAAMLASVGAGIHASLDQAATRMVRHKHVITPESAAVEHYAVHYENYLKLNELLLPTFKGNI